MNDKIINMGSKGLMIAIIVIGVVLSGVIMSYGNPLGLDKKATDAIGLEIAKSTNANEGKTQEELNAFIEESGEAKKKELLEEQGVKVLTTTTFTMWVIYIAIGLIVLGVVLGVVSAPKEYIVGIIGMVVFLALLGIIYSMAGVDVPSELATAEAEKLKPGQEGLFTGGNWKVAGASIVSMIVLIVLAVVTIVGSEVYKIVKG